ncbi:Diphthamide biosynthesis protein 3 [Coemansia javaensis]|uniref:Diphthamide biosynthesis protein 3 n=1 Tax=Coemansia javaensis TaxID=2761396 RepID=A0A9W8HGB2_9FUNG|nr:Diphthamide biosynthesis protein 3 [Coemansia javaensis]
MEPRAVAAPAPRAADDAQPTAPAGSTAAQGPGAADDALPAAGAVTTTAAAAAAQNPRATDGAPLTAPAAAVTVAAASNNNSGAVPQRQAAAESDAGFYDSIEIEDMDYDEDSETYYYPCPCGDRFQITREMLCNQEDVARCPSCSLVIRIIYDPEDFADGDGDDEEIELSTTIAVC